MYGADVEYVFPQVRGLGQIISRNVAGVLIPTPAPVSIDPSKIITRTFPAPVAAPVPAPAPFPNSAPALSAALAAQQQAAVQQETVSQGPSTATVVVIGILGVLVVVGGIYLIAD